ncbi:MAG: serpin family protein [Chthonomonadales bacterium]|nr:serpin family protein [Chthonomonadales bacterium]
MEPERLRVVLLTAAPFVLMLASLGACRGQGDGETPPAPPRTLAAAEPRFVSAVNDFGLRLYRRLASGGSQGNLFLSPVSVHLALDMVFNGAQRSTREAMAKTLALQGLTPEETSKAASALMEALRQPADAVQIEAANALWAREGLVLAPEFRRRTQREFDAAVHRADFASPGTADEVNAWVRDRTHGKIERIVDAATVRDAILLLVNALYFKGRWSVPFSPGLTQESHFHTEADGARRVPFMRRTAEMPYDENALFQAVALPYGDGRVRMVVILPKPGRSLADVNAQLTAERWRLWTGALAKRKGTLALPRFKTEYGTSLRPALAAMGMEVAFGGQADFGGMLAQGAHQQLTGRVRLSDVIHKTALEVNEEGTEAAAATGAVMGITSVRPVQPFQMTVDRPFLLAIEHQSSGALLFLGAIRDPR